MQFFYMEDELTGVEHNYLILPLEEKQFQRMRELCKEHIPSISCSAVIRKGHPYIAIDFGLYFRSSIPLDEVFYSGERLGDKLKVGDVLTVILTDRPQDQVITLTRNKMSFNVSLEELLVFSFKYTEEMHEIYTFYQLIQRLQSRSML